jgi:hypothetical protein
MRSAFGISRLARCGLDVGGQLPVFTASFLKDDPLVAGVLAVLEPALCSACKGLP